MLSITEFGGFNKKGTQSRFMELSELQFHTPAKLIPLRLCSLFDVYRRIFNSVYSALVPREPSLCDLSVW
jgi:hypothetical protein